MDPDDPEIQVIRLAYAAGVRFLLIGRQACILYGLPVLSFDYDLWVRPDRENLAHLVGVARQVDLTPSVPLDRLGETGFFRVENARRKKDIEDARALRVVLDLRRTTPGG